MSPVWGTGPVKAEGAEHPLGRSVCERTILVEHPPAWHVGDVVDELMDAVNEITEETRLIHVGAIKT